MTNPNQLWEKLQDAHLVSGPMPTLNPAEQPPAFFIRLLLGASGWLSAAFFCGFIALFFISLLSDATSLWILGIILCAVSVWISRIPNTPLFIEQFVFACSLSGQAFIVFATMDSSNSTQTTAAVLLVLESILFFAIAIPSQRTTAVFLAGAALLWLLGEHSWLYALPILSAISAWLWLKQHHLYRYRAYLQPIRIGATLGLWATILIALQANSTESTWWYRIPANWHMQLRISAVLTSILCLGLAWQLIKQQVQQARLRLLALSVSVAIALINLSMQGLAPLSLLLCIGVAQAHTRLIWFNLVALAGYLFLYYYSLNNTLLYKSILLCVSGALLLVLYALLNRALNTQLGEPDDHA